MALTAIIVKPEWYPDLKWGLEKVKIEATKKPMKLLASSSLRILEQGQRKFDKGEWDQLVFSTKQSKLISEIAELMDIPDASRRFGAIPVRS